MFRPRQPQLVAFPVGDTLENTPQHITACQAHHGEYEADIQALRDRRLVVEERKHRERDSPRNDNPDSDICRSFNE
jgi:hypothetical protein